MGVWDDIVDQANDTTVWPLLHFFAGSLIAFYLPEPNGRLVDNVAVLEMRLPRPSPNNKLFIFFTIIYAFESVEYLGGTTLAWVTGNHEWIETSLADSLVSDILMALSGWLFTALLIENDTMKPRLWIGIAHTLLIFFPCLAITQEKADTNTGFKYFIVTAFLVNPTVLIYSHIRKEGLFDKRADADTAVKELWIFTQLHTVMFGLISLWKGLGGPISTPALTLMAAIITTGLVLVYRNYTDSGNRAIASSAAYTPVPKTTGFII
jgi:hypothetical protein